MSIIIAAIVAGVVIGLALFALYSIGQAVHLAKYGHFAETKLTRKRG